MFLTRLESARFTLAITSSFTLMHELCNKYRELDLNQHFQGYEPCGITRLSHPDKRRGHYIKCPSLINAILVCLYQFHCLTSTYSGKSLIKDLKCFLSFLFRILLSYFLISSYIKGGKGIWTPVRWSGANCDYQATLYLHNLINKDFHLFLGISTS